MIQQSLRLLSIGATLIRYGLDEIVFSTLRRRSLRLILYLFPWNWFRRHRQPRSRRLRLMLDELGPTFVKFGQIISTRRDLLPEDIADELILLQDHVAPFPGATAVQRIEAALDQPLADIFETFDEQPTASASIAQVHNATLKDGTEVVVKVVRPGIKRIICRDVGLMYLFARLLQYCWGEAPRLRLTAIVAEYESVIHGEMDMLREAAAASQIRRNFKDSDLLYIPEVYWDYTRRDILVMGRISGIPVDDVAVLKARRFDLKRLAERGVEIFFIQVLEHNFFHADAHPGNLFVSADQPDKPYYISVDFGIMGTLSSRDQRYIADNMMAFFSRDYRRVSELHVESGWVPPYTNVEEFEFAIRVICEPILEQPLHQISFGQLLLRLFQTAHRFNMEVQPQLLLLQKTLLNIEGLGRQLYPELNVWAIAKPLLESWMRRQAGVSRLLGDMVQQIPQWSRILPELPLLAHGVLKQLQDKRASAQDQAERLRAARRAIESAGKRLIWALTAIAMLTLALVLLLLPVALPPVAEIPLLTWFLGGGGVVLLWVALRSRSRS